MGDSSFSYSLSDEKMDESSETSILSSTISDCFTKTEDHVESKGINECLSQIPVLESIDISSEVKVENTIADEDDLMDVMKSEILLSDLNDEDIPSNQNDKVKKQIEIASSDGNRPIAQQDLKKETNLDLGAKKVQNEGILDLSTQVIHSGENIDQSTRKTQNEGNIDQNLHAILKEGNLDLSTQTIHNGGVPGLRTKEINNAKGSYKCDVCGKGYSSKTYLQTHLRIHSGDKPYVCSMCGYRSADKCQLNSHLRRIHSEERPYSCTDCGKSFKFKNSFKIHVLNYHGEKSFKCPVCSKAFGSKTNLEAHKKIHSNGKQYTCNVCGKTSNRRYNLKLHMRIHAAIGEKDQNSKLEIVTKIPLAGTSTSNEGMLSLTTEETHDETEKYKCAVCGKSYSSKAYLQTHLSIHSRERPYSCTDCDKTFKFKNSFKMHALNCHGEKSFKCPVCSKTFGSKTNLEAHKKSHYNRAQYKCNVCGKTSNRRYNIKMHMRIHVAEKPSASTSTVNERKLNLTTQETHDETGKCECAVCGKSFSSKTYLQTHLRIHSGEKPHVCDVCGQRFADPSSLNRHLKAIHSEEKPYSCTGCGKPFKFKNSFKRHVLNCHAEKSFKSPVYNKAFSSKASLEGRTKTHSKKRIMRMPAAEFPSVWTITSDDIVGSEEVNSDIESDAMHDPDGDEISREEHTGEVESQLETTSSDNRGNQCQRDDFVQRDTRSENGGLDILSSPGNMIHDNSLAVDFFCRSHSRSSLSNGVSDLPISRMNRNNSTKVATSSSHIKEEVEAEEESINSIVVNHDHDDNDITLRGEGMGSGYMNGINWHGSDQNEQRCIAFDEATSEKTDLSLSTWEMNNGGTVVLTTEEIHGEAAKCKCDVCGKSYSSKTYLQTHLRIHSGEKPYVCDVCGNSFADPSSLNRHLKAIHSEERPYICSDCGKSFKFNNGFKMHVLNCHAEKSFKCPVCSKAFGSKTSLAVHKKMHSKGKRYKCNVCGKTANRRSNLKRHMRNHATSTCNDIHEITVRDEELNYKSDAAYDIDEHKKVREDHTHIKEENQFDTAVSGNDNIFNPYPRNHLMHDTGSENCGLEETLTLADHGNMTHDKPYECSVCGYRCADLSDLNTHLTRIHSEEKTYRCNDCGKMFNLNYNFKLHVLNCHGEKSFKCPVCNKAFGSKTGLEAHKKIHSNGKQYKCNVCGKTSNRKYNLKLHMRIHAAKFPLAGTSTSKETIIAVGSEEVNSDNESDVVNDPDRHQIGREEHMSDEVKSQFESSASDYRSNQFQLDNFVQRTARFGNCGLNALPGHGNVIINDNNSLVQNCFLEPRSNNSQSIRAIGSLISPGDRYTSKIVTSPKYSEDEESINKLIVLHHDDADGSVNDSNGQQPFVCSVCNEKFAYASTLAKHIKRAHMEETRSSEEKYDCEMCSKVFAKQELLKKHMSTHNKLKSYKCSVCGKEFAQPGYLKRHSVFHTGVKPFTCAVCGKAFHHKYHLQSHMKNNHGEKLFQCKICDKAFGSRQSFHLHSTVHSGEKPFLCTFCGKAFGFKSGLQSHLKRVHNGGAKRFKCSVCARDFIFLHELKRHLKTHEDASVRDKPHKCELCNWAFDRHHHLRRHMKIHYGEKPHKCSTCSREFRESSDLKKHMRTHARE